MSTKSSILSALQSADTFLSGEDLADLCSVSRTAIWKAIKALESEGYKIEAVTNRGYKLISEPDILSSQKIQKYLSDSKIKNVKIFTFQEIDSTNSEAKRRSAETGAFRDATGSLTPGGESLHLSLFAAESQTGGKGRLGRSFVSPKDSGVYFSLLYSPKGGVKNPAIYTAAAAVAVSRAIKNIYNETTSIKWVNDIFLNEKKICGILVEGITNFETGNIDAAIIGIGINIKKNPDIKGDLSKIAGSIEEAQINSGKDPVYSTKNQLVAEVTKNLIGFYKAFDSNGEKVQNEMISDYINNSMLIGKKLTVNPVAGSNFESYSATVKGITNEIKLVVEDNLGHIHELNSGEVSLHSYDFI